MLPGRPTDLADVVLNVDAVAEHGMFVIITLLVKLMVVYGKCSVISAHCTATTDPRAVRQGLAKQAERCDESGMVFRGEKKTGKQFI